MAPKIQNAQDLPAFASSSWNFETARTSGLLALQAICFAYVITSAEEGGYVFGSVCLSVCPSHYSQTCERILTKFFVGVGHGSRTK